MPITVKGLTNEHDPASVGISLSNSIHNYVEATQYSPYVPNRWSVWNATLFPDIPQLLIPPPVKTTVPAPSKPGTDGNGLFEDDLPYKNLMSEGLIGA